MDKIKVFDGCFNPIKYIKNDDIFIVLTPEEKNVLMVTREKFNEVVPDTANENNKLTDKEYVDGIKTELDTDITIINSKIPSTASDTNKLTDKLYVDELVNDEQTRAENIELLLDTAIKAEQTRAESVELQLQNTTEKTSNKTDVLNNQNPSSIKYPSEKGVVTYVTNELSQPKSDIAIINSKIPSTASSTNKLADKDFVNSSISTNTATFRGTFNVVTDLRLEPSATLSDIEAALAKKILQRDNNDYSFVQIPTDSTAVNIKRVDRYKFNGTNWEFEYSLNNSGFTAEQWAAINSTITILAVNKLNTLPTKDEIDSIIDDINDSIDIIDEVTAEGLYNLNERKQDIIEDLETIRSGAALGETAYQKPLNGIPARDIANGVIPDVSQFITKSVNDLVNYYTKSLTYTQSEVNALIGSIQQFHYEIFASLQDITTPANNVLYLIGPSGSGSDKYEEYVYANNSFTKIGDTTIDLSGYVTTQALNTALADYVTSTDLTTLLSGKQDNLVSGTNIKTINGQSVLGSGNLDVKDIFWVEYYTTPFADILAAYNAGKTLFANYAGMKFVNTAVGIENDSNAFLFSMSGVDENDKIFIFSFAVTSNNGSTDYSNIYSKMLQEELISGTNIKSINNESILGAGNVNFAKYEDTLISSDAITCETTETVEGVSVYSSDADYYIQPNQKIVFADTVGDNTLYIINYDDLNNPFIISSGKGSIRWNNFTNNDVRIQLASSSNVGQTLSASRYWRGTDDVFIAEYGVTTYQEILDAYNAGKIVIAIKGDLILTLSRFYDKKFYFGSVVGNVSYNVEVSKNNQWFYHALTIETVSNKAANFTTLDNVKYPTTKAVADYVSGIVGNINSILETI